MFFAALSLVCLLLSVVVTALLVVLLSDLAAFIREPSRGMPTCRRVAADARHAMSHARDVLSGRFRGRDPLR